jgi:hypothetical protein
MYGLKPVPFKQRVSRLNPRSRTWDDMIYFQCFIPELRRPAIGYKKARKGRSSPDFLLSFLAPPNLMRLSLMKAAHVGVGSAP